MNATVSEPTKTPDCVVQVDTTQIYFKLIERDDGTVVSTAAFSLQIAGFGALDLKKHLTTYVTNLPRGVEKDDSFLGSLGYAFVLGDFLGTSAQCCQRSMTITHAGAPNSGMHIEEEARITSRRFYPFKAETYQDTALFECVMTSKVVDMFAGLIHGEGSTRVQIRPDGERMVVASMDPTISNHKFTLTGNFVLTLPDKKEP